MNKILFVLILIVSGAGTLLAQNMTAVGASTYQVNGIYVDTGEYDGVRYYQKGGIYLYRAKELVRKEKQ